MGHIDPDEDLKAALERLKVAKERVERELAAIMMEPNGAETHRYPRSQTKRRRRMNPYSGVLPPVPDSSEYFAINGYLLWDRVIEPLVDKMKQAAIEVKVETSEEGVKTIRISGTVEDHSGGKQFIRVFQLKGENEVKMEFELRKFPQEKEDHSGDEATTVDEAG